MKKDIEWLNNEVEKIIEKIKTGKGAFLGIRFFDEGYIHGMRDVQSIANQLDEPEVLSQKWIDEHTYHEDEYDFYYADPDELKNLLVPKQDLPVVPTWFDEWWKDIPKGEGNLLHNIDQFHDKLYSYGTREVCDYINDTGNKKKLLNIIINELEYEVEEEQKYYVLFGNPPHDDNWIYALTNSGSIEIFEKDVLPEWDRTKLTEQEIKDYDERYLAFKVPVEEMK